MREAAIRLRDVVAKKDIVPLLTHYIAREGMLYASDGHLAAATPITFDQSFAVRAVEFHKFLDKTPGDIKIQVLENHHVKVSCGRFRATIPGLVADDAPFHKPHGQSYKVDAAFFDKLRALRPFVSDNATQPWAAAIHLVGGDLWATNNIVLARAPGSGLPESATLAVPHTLVDVVLSRPHEIKSMHVSDTSLGFTWKDGSWVNSTILAVKLPNFGPVLDKCPEPDFELSDEWLKTYEHLASFADNLVEFRKDKITVRAGASEFEGEAVTELPEGRDVIAFDPRFVGAIFAQANKVKFFMAPGPRLAFVSGLVHGLAAGVGK